MKNKSMELKKVKKMKKLLISLVCLVGLIISTVIFMQYIYNQPNSEFFSSCLMLVGYLCVLPIMAVHVVFSKKIRKLTRQQWRQVLKKYDGEIEKIEKKIAEIEKEGDFSCQLQNHMSAIAKLLDTEQNYIDPEIRQKIINEMSLLSATIKNGSDYEKNMEKAVEFFQSCWRILKKNSTD